MKEFNIKRIIVLSNLILLFIHSSYGQWAEVGGTNSTVFQNSIFELSAQGNGNLTVLENNHFYVNSTLDRVKTWDGSSWANISNGFLSGSNISLSSSAGGSTIAVLNRDSVLYSPFVYDYYDFVYLKQSGFWRQLHRTSGTDSLEFSQVHVTKNGEIYAVANIHLPHHFQFFYNYVYRWDGQTWIGLYGLSGFNFVASNFGHANLKITSDTLGNIYAYGQNAKANTNTLIVSRWNGTNWIPVLSAASESFPQIDSMFNYSNGTISTLYNNSKNVNDIKAINTDLIYVSGNYLNSDSLFVISKWDGSSWTNLPRISTYSNMRNINFDASSTGDIYAGGGLLDSLDKPYIAKFTGNAWTKLLGFDTIIPKNWFGVYIKDAYSAMFYTNQITVDVNQNVYWTTDSRNENGYLYVSKFNPNNFIPVFTKGNTEQMYVRINSGMVSLSSQLEISDFNVGQTELYTLRQTAAHGAVTLGGNIGSGLQVSPAGWFYTPDLNYSGFDTIVIRVDDGEGGKVLKTIAITVSNPVVGSVSSNQTICINTLPGSITLSGSVGYIQWQSSSNGFAFANIAGATSNVLEGYMVGNLASTKYFRAVVSIGVLSLNSATVTVNISNCTSDLLYDLILSKGSVSPTFYSYDTLYHSSVSNIDSTIQLTVFEDDVLANTELSLNNGVYTTLNNNVISPELNLNIGSNEFKFRVRSANNLNIRYYYLYVFRTGIPPIIDSVSTYLAKVSDTIQIFGSGFNSTAANNKVYFGSTAGNVVNSTSNFINVIVPVGASLNFISVMNNSSGLTAYSKLLFAPQFSPTKDTVKSNDFDAPQYFTVPSGVNKVAIGDFDNDGKPDMAVANGNAGISVYKHNGSIGSISFAARQDFVVGSWFSGNADIIKSADIDGDGKLDLVFTLPGNMTISVIRNISGVGGIDFDAVQHFSMGWNGLSKMSLADMDADGRLDIVFSTNFGGLSILKNSSNPGNINFDTKQDFATNNAVTGLSIGDLDGDKKIDLAFVYPNDTLIGVLRNLSSGSTISFASELNFGSGSSPKDLVLGDLDGDGKSDLVGVLNNNEIFSLLNTSSVGNISFNAKQVSPASAQNKKLVLAELNGDGLPEILYLQGGPWSDNLSILSNKSSIGNIQFSSETALTSSFSNSYYGLDANDIDGDGKMDIVAGLWNGTGYVAGVYRNILQTSNVYLNNIVLQNGTLNPMFDSTRLNYLIPAGSGVSNMGLTVSFSDITSNAQIRINGGAYSSLTHQTLFNALPLITGSNNIEIKVNGSDGISHQTYRLHVIKAAGAATAYLDITAYFQGLYLGGSAMTSTINNFDNTLPATVADTIVVELHESSGTFDSVYAWRGTIGTIGIANVDVPGVLVGDSFYIVLKHRNSIETWSSSPVTISAFCAYDFSNAATKAYGNNLMDLGSSVYGIFSGDINQDGSIDFLDYPDLDQSSLNGDLGYLVMDLNGDASVDFLDYPAIDQNSLDGIILSRP